MVINTRMGVRGDVPIGGVTVIGKDISRSVTHLFEDGVDSINVV